MTSPPKGWGALNAAPGTVDLRCMDSGRRSILVRSALRIAGTSLAALVALGLAPAVAVAAPTDAQVAAAAAAAAQVETRIKDLNAQLTAAEESVDNARAVSAIALDDYQAAQSAVQAAQQKSAAAQAAATQATADLGVARGDVVAFARRSYMQGSTYSGAAALITATDPGELIERAALLEAAGAHRSDVLDTVTVLQEQAAQADEVARTALVQITVLQEQAATALATAQAAEVSAREQAAVLTTQQATLQTELASAQQELQELIGAQEAAARAAGQRRPAAGGQQRAGRHRGRVGGPGGDRRGDVPARAALRVGRWRHQRPRPRAGARPRRHRLRLQRPDPVRLRPRRDLDPAQQPGAVRVAAQGRQRRPAAR